ncbi:MAG: 6-phosphogluconolactonase, partial [Candidatus Sulfotelmatobacter sp.]
MVLKVFDDKNSLAKAAAEKAAAAIRSAIRDRGQARVIAATGTSQFEFLATLTESSDIDWGRVELFHLDEYIGLPATHPASFRKILLERLVNKTGIAKFHPLNGDARDLSDVIRRVGDAVASAAVDIAFVGVGENGH